MDLEAVRKAEFAHAHEKEKREPPTSKPQNLGASAYSYPALELSHICILVLEPSFDNDAPLHFSFRSASLSDLRGRYEAVSYTWGEPNLVVPLHHNDGSQVLVTANLDMALRHLRHRLDKRWLWADAVCIDQRNPQEKATQMPMMDKIYQGAKGVLAWLGPGGDDVEKGMTLLERMSQHPKDFETPKIFDPPGSVPNFSLVHSFFEVPRFRRFWTIQERILNVDVIFICGQESITLARLLASLRLFTLAKRWGAAVDPPGLRAFAKTGDLWRVYSIVDEQPSSDKIPAFDILNLVHSFVEHDCRDDRDRIYAVYAMASNIAPTTDIPREERVR
jgi:hypothetical protein